MEKADVRINPIHYLAVEFEDETQHAVGGRVLRAEVDVEVSY